jgi:hypothetical protein
MNPHICQHEAAVIEAVAAGRLPDELSRHAADCQSCAETLAVFEHMNNLAAVENASHAPLPSPDAILWRSQIRLKRRHAEESVAAIRAVQRIAAALLLSVVIVAGVIWGPRLQTALPMTTVLLSIVGLIAASAAAVFYLRTLDSPHRFMSGRSKPN